MGPKQVVSNFSFMDIGKIQDGRRTVLKILKSSYIWQWITYILNQTVFLYIFED